MARTGRLVVDITERRWFPFARVVAIVGIRAGLWSCGSAAMWLAKHATAKRLRIEPSKSEEGQA